MKAFARELAIQRLNLSRIPNGMMRRFDLDLRTLPKLSTVQRYVGNYKRHHLGLTISTILLWKPAAYIGSEEDNVGFPFGWRKTVDGMPHVGKGTDDDPFILGITSKRLLQFAARDPSTFVLHVDATFKLNSFYYPVVVIGVSDRLRTFHMLALFIVSQRTEPVYVERRAFFRVVGVPLKVNYVMTDAEAAMHFAFEGVFAADNSYTQLMCWYHVVAKVYQHTNRLPTTAREVAMADVFAMNFARGQTEFDLLQKAAFKRWTCNPMLVHFAAYFSKVWLSGKATCWQCYWTPGGFAKIIRQFNKVLKRDYTNRRRQKVGALITLLLSCCTVESMKVAPFCQTPGAQTKLKSRTREMIRGGKVFEYVPKKSPIAFLVDDPLPPAADGVVRVVSAPCPRIYKVEFSRTKEQILVSAHEGTHTGRMEHKDMPSTGWRIDTTRRWCPYRYFFKFEHCIHLGYALSLLGIVVKRDP
ncbi:LOW QUALITY PROTEIN: hypothetical protein PHMEG_00022110 [Phytophthora megakarya]|uniref:MULE transposase domain-containing protein n=1 Tax=Phytophthora megakarya TaxID=4795 RepID=A0A225VMI8_9STRA|nr:LOW QUALITY PROTEIN: hypothetical protein PHMEG_00022110 [Phytophthora megakarya]